METPKVCLRCQGPITNPEGIRFCGKECRVKHGKRIAKLRKKHEDTRNELIPCPKPWKRMFLTYEDAVNGGNVSTYVYMCKCGYYHLATLPEYKQRAV